jgi:hypothetical protein
MNLETPKSPSLFFSLWLYKAKMLY